MKILNLYAGIGGNRKLWGSHDITAVELDPKIAEVYSYFYPQDKMIVADAHQYLLEHYDEFDFIWTSPPCPTHSQLGRLRAFTKKGTGQYSPPKYPDMKLYEEILFLQHYFKGKYVVENVVAYYKPLVEPQLVQRHHFWSNIEIPPMHDLGADNIEKGNIQGWQERFGYDLTNFKGIEKRKVLRNCVHPELGLHIFNAALTSINN